MTLYDQLQNVTDPTSFLAFARALHADRVANGADWQRDSIEHYLEAALDWAESTHMGKTQGLNDAPPWKRFAMFLYCGKIYE